MFFCLFALTFFFFKIITMEEENTTVIEFSITPKPIIFCILLFIEILSIMCSLIISMYLFFHWNSMIIKVLHNHAVLLLTIISFLYTTLDLSFTFNSQLIDYDNPQTLSFCRWWYWIDWTLLVVSLFLTATASIQRHILIFNNHWLNTHRTRLILHYIPLIFSIFYPAIFYLICIFFYPCEMPTYDYVQYCPYPCYADNLVLYKIDYTVHAILPLIIIVVANVILVCRVFHSMLKVRQRHFDIWKRQKKLTLQLFAFSSLYVIGWCSVAVVSVMEMFSMSNGDIPEIDYITFPIYFVCGMQSFICMFTLPELIKYIKSKR